MEQASDTERATRAAGGDKIIMHGGMMYKRLFLILVILLPLYGCFSSNATRSGYPIEIVTQGTFVHEATGMRFPEAVGSFHRTDLTRYDASGTDVSASYEPDDSSVNALITVYIYPVPKKTLTEISTLPPLFKRSALSATLDDWFDGVKKDVTGHNPLAVLISEEGVQVTQHETTYEGKKATFSYLIYGNQEVLTHAYLFIYDDWFIKYRVTHLQRDITILEPEFFRFMELLQWP